MPDEIAPDIATLDAAYAYCAEQVRAQDRDRFLAALFAPEDKRRHLLALYAFNLDVARVREVVREALPGEVRLAWWREVIEGQGRGSVEGHPIAAALLDTAERFALPRASLIALVDARIFDLYDDPMPKVVDLEGYAGETAAALLQLSALVLSPQAASGTGDLSGHGGVAIAMTGLMRAFPIHAARGQCYLPLDLLARHGIGRDEAVSGKASPALLAALSDLRAEAKRHLGAAREAAARLGPAAAFAAPYLPLALVPGDLKALARVRDPFQEVAGLSPFRRQFALWRGSRRAAAGKVWF
ncbi:squalene/phytoene synthase family protein [Xanthobacter autotrophicus]|uniref:phytoene/squalene synthase family protein n=1 Tax=Xanthobacter TaxID=279 RepID=UPI0024AC7A93|nr:squalene/phytoene synthase family protein [Xanthobacter autotrophicus]MDI4662774.1 squalene/phytoene synthase family protein [Xanthobacter autotrophicus]